MWAHRSDVATHPVENFYALSSAIFESSSTKVHRITNKVRQKLAPIQGIQDSLGFWIPHRVDSGFQLLDYNLCKKNLDSGFHSPGDPGSLEIYSGFPSPGFRIQRAKFRSPQANIFQILE